MNIKDLKIIEIKVFNISLNPASFNITVDVDVDVDVDVKNSKICRSIENESCIIYNGTQYYLLENVIFTKTYKNSFNSFRAIFKFDKPIGEIIKDVTINMNRKNKIDKLLTECV